MGSNPAQGNCSFPQKLSSVEFPVTFSQFLLNLDCESICDPPGGDTLLAQGIYLTDSIYIWICRVTLKTVHTHYKFSAISIYPAKTNLFSPWTLHLYTQSFLIAKVFKHLNTFSINALSKNLARKRSSALPN